MRKKILCLDVGAKIIGVAMSDAFGVMAFPRDEIKWGGSVPQLKAALLKLFNEEGAFSLVVLGKVRHDSHQSMVRASETVETLLEGLGWPYAFCDEHVSTLEASNRIADIEEESGAVFPHARRDSVAAQIILERYLTSC